MPKYSEKERWAENGGEKKSVKEKKRKRIKMG